MSEYERMRYARDREKRLKLANESYIKNKEKAIERSKVRSRTAEYKTWRKEYYQKNKVEIARKNKAWRNQNKNKIKDKVLRESYGITLEQYNLTALNQDNKCLICETKAKLVVDHCHVTGSFRGLLCSHCNCMLGNARDNIQILKIAIKYLEKVENGKRSA